MDEKWYQITLNEKQARLLAVACEDFFRLRMGQDADFADDIASMGHDWSNADDKNRDRLFEKYLTARDDIREVMKAVFHIAFGIYGQPKEKTEDMRIIEDIWEAIRFAMGASRWHSPLQVSDEPFPEVTVIEGVEK